MIDFLKQLLPERWKVFIKNFLYSFQRKQYLKEVKKREKLSIFDLKNLTREIELVSKEYGFNAFYGHDRLIKKLTNTPINEIFSGAIEHGFNHYENCINPHEIDIKNTSGNNIYTFSVQRKKHLEKHLPNKKVFAIGPYIKHIEGILSARDKAEIKNALGRILLVFPAHSGSSKELDSNFDTISLITEINKRKKEYDTVMVCMYWKDIVNNKHGIYQNQGYKVVTAGHLFDFNFLRRLRSIIELSDMTMSNSIGTHIGYCICLNKPHYLYYQDFNLFNTNSKKFLDLKSEAPDLFAFEIGFSSYFEKEIRSLFSKFSYKISKQQIDIIKKYWGEW